MSYNVPIGGEPFSRFGLCIVYHNSHGCEKPRQWTSTLALAGKRREQVTNLTLTQNTVALNCEFRCWTLLRVNHTTHGRPMESPARPTSPLGMGSFVRSCPSLIPRKTPQRTQRGGATHPLWALCGDPSDCWASGQIERRTHAKRARWAGQEPFPSVAVRCVIYLREGPTSKLQFNYCILRRVIVTCHVACRGGRASMSTGAAFHQRWLLILIHDVKDRRWKAVLHRWEHYTNILSYVTSLKCSLD